MCGGTILQHVQNNVLSTSEIVILLLDVAEGLAYLQRLHVVHGNLNGGNVLIDQDLHARLSGFSLAQFADTEGYDFGPTAWTLQPTTEDEFDSTSGDIEPEADEIVFRTSANDIYAFACLVLEIFTVRLTTENDDRDDTVGVQMPDTLWDLIRNCWLLDPSSRPRIEDVVEQMKEIA